MSDFRFEVMKKENAVHFQFFGSLKEEAKLPDLKTYQEKEVHVDLNGVDHMNSIGVRTWVVWVDEFKEYSFVFTNVPVTIVNQINLVIGFLPTISRVNSLFVPFDCETCDADVKVLFKNEEDFLCKDEKFQILTTQLTCPVCSDPIELSSSEERYFRFMKK